MQQIQYETFVMRTMSVSWQNRRCGQSLVAHGRVKKKLNYCRETMHQHAYLSRLA